MYFSIEIHWGFGLTLTRQSWYRVKATIKSRDQAICQYCGRHASDGEPDHVLPLARGGTDRLTNLVWACKECNQSKGNRTLREWLGMLHTVEPQAVLPDLDIVSRHYDDVVDL